jgi:hypothetical protein
MGSATVGVFLRLRGERALVPEDRRESEDELDHETADRVGRLGRDLDDTWVMVSPGIYRLREDMPQIPEPVEAPSLDDVLRDGLPNGVPAERE